MKVKREELLTALQFAKLGTSLRGEMLEQSNSFVFVDGNVVTFNDEIKTTSHSPLGDIEAAVIADDLLRLLEKLPDEEIEVGIKKGKKGHELSIKGKKRRAGVTCFAEITLPYDEIPKPEKWSKLGEGVVEMLQHASHICGNNITDELTTYVHVTPDYIEASDNRRLLRADMETGFPEECLLPAKSLKVISSVDIRRVSVGEGWVHFRASNKGIISIRCSHQKYHKDMDKVLNMGDNPQAISFPANLAELVGRAAVMLDTEGGGYIQVELDDGQLTLSSQRDTGWYAEDKRVKYSGTPLSFYIKPTFLQQLLERTRKAEVSEDGGKMKITADHIQFLTALVLPDEL